MEYLAYLTLLVPFGAALIVPVFLSWGAIRAGQRALAGFWIIASLYLYEVLVIAPAPFSLGINIFPADLVFVLIAVLAAWRLSFGRQLPFTLPLLAWLSFGVLSIGLAAAGIATYRTPAGVEFREIFYLICAVAYFASFSIDRQGMEKMLQQLHWLVGALVLVALFRWTDEVVGLTGIRWGLLVGANIWRVLNSDQAMLILIVWLWSFIAWSYGRLSFRGVLWMQSLLVLLVLLQHRTVWVCGVAALLALMALDGTVRKAVLGRGLLTVVIALIGLALLAALGKLDAPLQTLGQSVSEATSGRGSTFQWRLQSWQELIGTWRSGGPVSWLVGQLYGAGWRRYIADLQNISTHSPHSFYVHTLLRGGLLGVVLILATLALTAFQAWRLLAIANHREPLLFAVAVMLVVAVYSITYNPGYGTGIAMGLVIGYVARARMIIARQVPNVLLKAA